jgi:hypothetical protein
VSFCLLGLAKRLFRNAISSENNFFGELASWFPRCLCALITSSVSVSVTWFSGEYLGSGEPNLVAFGKYREEAMTLNGFVRISVIACVC